jgi:hypothetical protein
MPMDQNLHKKGNIAETNRLLNTANGRDFTLLLST